MGVPVILSKLLKSDWPWVYQRAAPVLCSDTQGIVALRDKEIVAAVVFDSWTANSCLVHIAIEDPRVTRRLLRAGFNHVFVTAGRKVIYGLTPANNEKALRFNKRLGFTELLRMKDAFEDGVDYVLQELRKEDCKWLRKDVHIRTQHIRAA